MSGDRLASARGDHPAFVEIDFEAGNGYFVRCFVSGEARAAAKFRHPNVVAIHDVGEQEGQLYFTMDYIEGIGVTHIGIGRGQGQARRG